MSKLLRVRRVHGEISTDDIIPARYKHMYTDPADMAPHVFEGRFPGFAATLRDGDMLVCTGIFGIGSSREQAVSALRACGIRMVVAPEFGRIFFRNTWNLGVPAIRANPSAFPDGREVEVELAAGRFLGMPGLPEFSPPPPMLLEMVEAGGLLALIKRGVTPAMGGATR